MTVLATSTHQHTHQGVLCGLEPRWGEGGQWRERQSSQNVSKLIYNIIYCLPAAPGIIAGCNSSWYKKFYDVI